MPFSSFVNGRSLPLHAPKGHEEVAFHLPSTTQEPLEVVKSGVFAKYRAA
jgi:hypothetical protein